MRLLLFLVMFVCSGAYAGNFAVVPNVSYLQTDTNTGCNNCVSNATGTLLIRGFATENANIYINVNGTGNCINRVELPDLVSVNNAKINIDGSAGTHGCLTSFVAPVATSVSFSAKYSPVTSVFFPKLTTVPCGHIYFTHSIGGTLTSVDGAFPKLTTMIGALVLTGNVLTAITDSTFPLLATMGDQLELDANALTSVSIGSLTAINGHNACTGDTGVDIPGILLGGQTGAALTNVHLDGLLNFSGLISAENSGIVNFTMAALNQLGDGTPVITWQIDLSHNKMTTASLDALFNQLGAPGVAITVTTGAIIDVRFQTPTASPTSASVTARGRLTSAGVTLLCDAAC